MNVKMLQKDYEALTSSLTCCVAAEDYERLKNRMKDIKHLSEIENRAVSLYDINTKSFILKSHKNLELLGYTDTELDELLSVEKYHTIIHPDDAPFLYDSEIRLYTFLSRMNSDEKKSFKLICDYRVKSKKETYIRFLQQFMIFETDKYSNAWIMLIITDVLSAFPNDAVSRRFVIHTKTRNVYLFNEENGIGKTFLTNRETEILQLISQGYDSSTIAEKLFISVSTVNNHRQHILEKTYAKNITQALSYCKAAGLI